MSFFDVNIGDLVGFDWTKEAEQAKPARLGPFFPSASTAFWKVFDRARASKLEGRQLDWSAWGLRATGSEIAALVEEVYGIETEDEVFGRAYLDDQLLHLREVVKSLEPNKLYALVAMET